MIIEVSGDDIVKQQRIAREKREAQRLQPLLERIFPGIVELIKEMQSVLKESRSITGDNKKEEMQSVLKESRSITGDNKKEDFEKSKTLIERLADLRSKIDKLGETLGSGKGGIAARKYLQYVGENKHENYTEQDYQEAYMSLLRWYQTTEGQLSTEEDLNNHRLSMATRIK